MSLCGLRGSADARSVSGADAAPKAFGATAFITIAAAAITLIGGATTAKAEWVEWIADAEAVYSSSDNINNAVFDRTEESDTILTPTFSGGRIFQMTDFTRLIITADASAAFHSEFNKLNFTTVGASMAIRHKYGIGLRPFWGRVGVSVAAIDSDSELRDGTESIVTVSAGKWIHERVNVTLGYAYDKRNSNDTAAIDPVLPSSVFDLEGHTGSVNVDLLLTPRSLLTFGYSHRVGDVASTCTPDIVPLVLPVIDAIALDDVFPYVACAYRMDATTNTFAADLSYSFLRGHASANVGYLRVEGEASKYLYINNIWRASVNYTY